MRGVPVHALSSWSHYISRATSVPQPPKSRNSNSDDLELPDTTALDAAHSGVHLKPSTMLPSPNSSTALLAVSDPPRRFINENALNRRTLKKLDTILLPFLSLLFLLNSLDRSNIGNAETANFTRDIGLKPRDLNTAVALFFVFFVSLQPLGAAAGRRWGMARWVPAVMALWGLLTAAHIFIRHKWELIAIRILIGILEAGFYPTTVSYLSLFYTRYEFARRLGLFYGQYAIAGALGGVISYAVFSAFPSEDIDPYIERDGPRSPAIWTSWRLLFLLEGSLTIVVALAGFFWLPRRAGTAWFLNSEERKWAEYRIAKDRLADSPSGLIDDEEVLDGGGGGIHGDIEGHYTETPELEQEQHLLQPSPSSTPSSMPLSRSHAARSDFASDQGLSSLDILEAFSDWKIWYLLAVNICSSVPAMAFSVFLPLVVKGLGFDSVHANLLTAPPFLTGALVLWIFTWWSDKHKERIAPILLGLVINLIGLTAVVMLPDGAYAARYFALCILLGGSFIASPLTVAWLSGNIQEPGKRAIVLGINGWGNLAGVFSALLFDPKYAPSYTLPFYLTLCAVLFSLCGYTLFRHLLIRENRLRRDILRRWSAEQVALEERWGKGPELVGARRGLVARIAARGCYLLPVRQWPHRSVRRGDEKMTFFYGL
ncbi:MAG: hypothetical protein M1829_000993 [Trizodia sp. TS-e1964]|nr:MAG: hypothetical protein M1829_000993 [Trizodia sp. TS-e1964]